LQQQQPDAGGGAGVGEVDPRKPQEISDVSRESLLITEGSRWSSVVSRSELFVGGLSSRPERPTTDDQRPTTDDQRLPTSPPPPPAHARDNSTAPAAPTQHA